MVLQRTGSSHILQGGAGASASGLSSQLYFPCFRARSRSLKRHCLGSRCGYRLHTVTAASKEPSKGAGILNKGFLSMLRLPASLIPPFGPKGSPSPSLTSDDVDDMTSSLEELEIVSTPHDREELQRRREDYEEREKDKARWRFSLGKQADDSSRTSESTRVPFIELVGYKPVIAVAGGGIFFFWEIGALKYLSENFDLRKAAFSGASAGALASVLLVCGVDLDTAVRKAYQLSLKNDIWNRSGGLVGIWGSLIRDWLEELLPADAAQRCSGRVQIVVTEAPRLRLRSINQFGSKEDVINACMASVHVPFFLDGNPTYQVRGRHYLDGSLYDFLTGGNSQLLCCNGAAEVVDYFFDDQLQFSRLDFLKLTDYEEVKNLVRFGYAWAQRTDEAGGFEEKLGMLRKSLARKALELPGRQFQKTFYAEV